MEMVGFVVGASRLDTDASLAPVSPLGVVPVVNVRQRPVRSLFFLSSWHVLFAPPIRPFTWGRRT